MMRHPRLLPLVAFAALCLAGLKITDLVLGGGQVLSGVASATAQDGASGEATDAATAPAASAAPAAPAVPPPVVTSGPQISPTRTEMEVLESLAQRRKVLDQRERELQLRENLLRAAEARVESRIKELKSIEARIEAQLQKQEDERKEQQDRLVKMYTSMRPKDAAKIFNQMAPDVLSVLAGAMNPRAMSAILAEMDPAAAQRLTVELANKTMTAPEPAGELPKIEGQGPS